MTIMKICKVSQIYFIHKFDRYHPDKNADNPEASELFKEVAFSYSILSDPEKKRQYDSAGFEVSVLPLACGSWLSPLLFCILFWSFFIWIQYRNRNDPIDLKCMILQSIKGFPTLVIYGSYLIIASVYNGAYHLHSCTWLLWTGYTLSRHLFIHPTVASFGTMLDFPALGEILGYDKHEIGGLERTHLSHPFGSTLWIIGFHFLSMPMPKRYRTVMLEQCMIFPFESISFWHLTS